MTQTQYEGYSVNEQGHIFSTKFNKVRKLKSINHPQGYLLIGLSNNNKVKQMLVHRLIAETFISNPENKPEVNHKNGIKTDNRVQNLEWVTPKENTNHAILNGLVDNRGEKCGTSKLTEKQVLEIRELHSTKTFNQRKLAEIYGIKQNSISLIVNKKNWKHI